MKTFVPSLLMLGLSVVLDVGTACAGDRPAPLRKGKVLVLKNEYTIEGDIERVGDSYCVRKKLGEQWVPAERALALVASLPDAYIYLRGRINLDDPDERLRLAHWCLKTKLQEQALAELQAAANLRPDHAETRRLLRYWQQEAATHVPTSSKETKEPVPAQPTADSPPIEVTTDSLGLFATRVQPILMNTCARCHATGRGGNFRLTQVFEDTISNRRSLERNLASVLAEVNVYQPEASRLLIKAVSDHAHTGQAPLRDRQAAPYRTLESWVKRTVADNPHLRDRSEIRNPKPEPSIQPSAEPQTRGGEESQWGTETKASSAARPSGVAVGDKGKASPPTNGAKVTPVDPYDPEPFNRKMHPEANK